VDRPAAGSIQKSRQLSKIKTLRSQTRLRGAHIIDWSSAMTPMRTCFTRAEYIAVWESKYVGQLQSNCLAAMWSAMKAASLPTPASSAELRA
jgi:hypothetical protein